MVHLFSLPEAHEGAQRWIGDLDPGTEYAELRLRRQLQPRHLQKCHIYRLIQSGYSCRHRAGHAGPPAASLDAEQLQPCPLPIGSEPHSPSILSHLDVEFGRGISPLIHQTAVQGS